MTLKYLLISPPDSCAEHTVYWFLHGESFTHFHYNSDCQCGRKSNV